MSRAESLRKSAVFRRGDRVVLRRFHDDDLDAFVGYRGDPEVARYQSFHELSRSMGALFIAAMHTAEPNVPGTWFQIAVDVPGLNLMGDCALHTIDDREMELVFSFSRAHQGRGLATEAVRLVVDLARELGKARLIAVTDARNGSAIRLLQRVGMHLERTVDDVMFKGAPCTELHFALALQSEPLRH